MSWRIWWNILPPDPQHRSANATVILAVATLAVSIFSLLTWCTLNKQLDEMKESFAADRAYFLFSHVDNETPLASGKTVVFVFKNFGRTPADFRANGGRCSYGIDFGNGGDPRSTVTQLESLFYRHPPSMIPGLSDASGLGPVNSTIESGKETSAAYKIAATDSEIAQAKSGRGRVFCASLLLYDDMRGNHRKTGVYVAFDFGMDAFTLVPDERWNFHT
jgi:hypothetical protein